MHEISFCMSLFARERALFCYSTDIVLLKRHCAKTNRSCSSQVKGFFILPRGLLRSARKWDLSYKCATLPRIGRYSFKA